MDVTLIANECVDTRIKGIPLASCKLDTENAYDHINWDFLLNIFHQMDPNIFGERWLKWIRACMCKAFYFDKWRICCLCPIKERS